METKINIVHCPLAEVGSHIPEFSGLFIICDRNVSWIPEKIGALAEGVYTIEATEQNKTIGTVAEICRWLMEQGADRKAFLLGIGGGVTTDITGFAASVYKRGVKFGFIPTTLLSQVDAAIGGKNGVNLDSFKNMVGVIRQPEATFICPEPLETLPDTQMVSGAAELLKTFIINNDNDNYFKAVDALKSKSRDLGPLVAEAAKVKAGIASRDPEEHGERRLLNLGHTFAHAIEKLSEESIGHGQAVAMGIIMAARLSEKVGTAEFGLSARLESDFKACGLPTECPFGISEMAGAMKKDKKAEGSIVHFVLPVSIGHVETRDLTVEEVVKLLEA